MLIVGHCQGLICLRIARNLSCAHLTHWGGVTHICVVELGHHWFRWWLVACSASSHYLNQCWNIVNWTLGNKLQWNLNQNLHNFIQENVFENVVWEMSAILSHLNVLSGCQAYLCVDKYRPLMSESSFTTMLMGKISPWNCCYVLTHRPLEDFNGILGKKFSN